MVKLTTAVGDRLADALDLVVDFATLGEYGYQAPQLAAGTGRTCVASTRACAARSPAHRRPPAGGDRARRRLGAPADDANSLRA
jgi:hypothetical protein